MIKIGENPEHNPKLNKFIAKSTDGQRGVILALHKNKKQAIILALNCSVAGDVKWGKLYLVKETKPGAYPTVAEEVYNIPDKGGWTINEDLMR